MPFQYSQDGTGSPILNISLHIISLAMCTFAIYCDLFDLGTTYMLPKYSVKVFLGILGFTHIIVFVPKQKWNQYVYSFTEYKITPNWSRNQILWKFCINPATSHLAFNMHIKWKREVENRKVLQRDLF